MHRFSHGRVGGVRHCLSTDVRGTGRKPTSKHVRSPLTLSLFSYYSSQKGRHLREASEELAMDQVWP